MKEIFDPFGRKYAVGCGGVSCSICRCNGDKRACEIFRNDNGYKIMYIPLTYWIRYIK